MSRTRLSNADSIPVMYKQHPFVLPDSWFARPQDEVVTPPIRGVKNVAPTQFRSGDLTLTKRMRYHCAIGAHARADFLAAYIGTSHLLLDTANLVA